MTETTAPQHGTDSGYQRHRRAGEKPCEECRQARRDYVREFRHRTGRSKGTYLTVMEIGHLSGKLGDFW